MDYRARDQFMKLFYGTPRAQEIYSSLRHHSEAGPSTNNEDSFLDVPDELSEATDTPAHDQIGEIKVQSDHSFCTCDEPTMAVSECESKASEVFKKMELYSSCLLQDDQTQRELLNWSLKIVNDHEIIVEGRRSIDPPDICWRTSVICERISTNVIQSKKGTLYFLLGQINEKDMIEKCFPDEITKMFKYGFPPNWRDIFSMTGQRERKSIGQNQMKTPVTSIKTPRRIVNEKTNAGHGMDETDYGIAQANRGVVAEDHGKVDKDHGIVEENHEMDEEGRGIVEEDNGLVKADHGINEDHGVNEEYYGTEEEDYSTVQEDRGIVEEDRDIVDEDNGTVKEDHGIDEEYYGTQEEDYGTVQEDRGINDEMTLQAYKLRDRVHLDRKTRVKDLSKTPSTSKPSKRNRKKKPKYSSEKAAVTESSGPGEIEVQRTRSGRIICPALEYWRGQRICTSPNDGEITIIKSNLEENSKITLVETSRNSSGLLQISSSEPTSGTTSSDKEWMRSSSKTDSTSSTWIENPQKKKSTQKNSLLRRSLRSDSRLAETTGSDTDSVGPKRRKSFNENTFYKNARTESTSGNKNKNDKRRASESSAVGKEIAKPTISVKLKKITETAKNAKPLRKGEPNAISERKTNIITPKRTRTRTRVEKAKDSDSRTDYPIKTRLRLNRGEDTHSNSVRETNLNDKNSPISTTQLIANNTEGNLTDSRRVKRQPHREWQTEYRKKLRGTLSTKTGTLARKRELRDMLEQQDEGYEDDAFEGTPFKNQKVSRTLQPKISPVESSSLLDVDEDIRDKNFKTPSSRTPMNRLRPAGPLSTEKSDVDSMTPGLLYSVNRGDVDRYVNQLKRQKVLNMRKKAEARTPLTTNKRDNKSAADDANYSFNVQRVSTIEDEEDEDYYCSDNE